MIVLFPLREWAELKAEWPAGGAVVWIGHILKMPRERGRRISRPLNAKTP